MAEVEPRSHSAALQRLASCRRCGAQYDVSELAVGARFRCACGALATVPPVDGHDAAVVRCSSCGAPRQQGAPACGFCGSDFTLHERDLDTLCPGCAARISRRARFCHGCGTPILPLGSAGEATERPCPACPDERRLSSRRLGGDSLTVLECPRCAGLWLGAEAFKLLEERARSLQTAAELGPPPDGRLAAGATSSGGRAYRPCPRCGKLMHRRNYGRRSGVIVDQCAGHGLWFDQGELEKILRWIRGGGLDRSEELEALKRREADRARDRSPAVGPLFESRPASVRPGRAMGDFVASLFDFLASRG